MKYCKETKLYYAHTEAYDFFNGMETKKEFEKRVDKAKKTYDINDFDILYGAWYEFLRNVLECIKINNYNSDDIGNKYVFFIPDENTCHCLSDSLNVSLGMIIKFAKHGDCFVVCERDISHVVHCKKEGD